MSQAQAEQTEWRGHIGPMSHAEVEAFLTTGTLCHLACLKDDSMPYVVPCWFDWNGEAFHLIPRQRSAWAAYLRQRPAVALAISEPMPPYRKVEVEGTAVIIEEPNIGGRWVAIARTMSLRYLGEHGPDYLEPTLAQPRWLIRVEPTRVRTWQGVGWHPRYVVAESDAGGRP